MTGDSKTEVTVVLSVLSVSNGILFLVENESVSKLKFGLGYLALKNTDFKTFLPHKVLLEICFVFVQPYGQQNTLDLQHPGWSLAGLRMCITTIRSSRFLVINSAALEHLRNPGILTCWGRKLFGMESRAWKT